MDNMKDQFNEESLASDNVTPSADYINAISEFFDTDPKDLLVELGYYKREAVEETDAQLVE